MRASEVKVQQFLVEYIDALLKVDEANVSQHLVVDAERKFLDDLYLINSWMEDLPEGKIVVVEVSRKSPFSFKVFCRGMLITSISRKVLDEEKMWGLGLG